MAEVRREDYRKGRRFKQEIRNPGFEAVARAYIATVHPTAGKGDYSDIQSAIDAVHNGPGHGTIFIVNGTYTQSSDIVMYSNITLLGEDNDNTIIDFNNGEYRIDISGVSGSEITNFNIKNLKIQNTNRGGINIYRGDDWSISNCKFSGNNGGPTYVGVDIYTEYADRGVIENNYSYGAETFCHLIASPGVLVRNNTVDFYELEALKFESGSNPLMLGNRIMSATTAAENAITLDSVIRARVIGNYVLIDEQADTGNGIQLRGGSSSNIINSNFFRSGNVGIQVGYNSTCNQNVISNNVFHAGEAGVSTETAISIQDSNRSVVVGNYVEVAGYGLVISAGCNETIALGNGLGDATTPLTDSGTNSEVAHNIT